MEGTENKHMTRIRRRIAKRAPPHRVMFGWGSLFRYPLNGEGQMMNTQAITRVQDIRHVTQYIRLRNVKGPWEAQRLIWIIRLPVSPALTVQCIWTVWMLYQRRNVECYFWEMKLSRLEFPSNELRLFIPATEAQRFGRNPPGAPWELESPTLFLEAIILCRIVQ